jgi:type IV pilus assembly protein PilA
LLKRERLQKIPGFSLLELMVVLAVIALLSMMAVPSYVSSTAKDQVNESLGLVTNLKVPVELFYRLSGKFPANNVEASIPAADKLLGNYVQAIVLENGAFHLAFGNKAVPALQGKVLTVRMLFVQDSPVSPVSWVCGYSLIPHGMSAAGENRTTVSQALLPPSCRALSAAVPK